MTCAAALAAITGPGQAAAPTPIFKLAFVDPTLARSLAATDSIEVWLRLTLDASAPAIDLVGGDVQRYLAWWQRPSEAQFWDLASGKLVTEAVADVTGVYLTTSFACGLEFTNNCGPGVYTFQWNQGADPAKPPLSRSLSLQPGSSIDYLFGTFVPNGSGAPPGLYHQNLGQFTLGLDVLSVTGRLGAAEMYTSHACEGAPECAFVRHVGVVPEPASYGLLALGLLMVAARMCCPRNWRVASNQSGS